MPSAPVVAVWPPAVHRRARRPAPGCRRWNSLHAVPSPTGPATRSPGTAQTAAAASDERRFVALEAVGEEQHLVVRLQLRAAEPGPGALVVDPEAPVPRRSAGNASYALAADRVRRSSCVVAGSRTRSRPSRRPSRDRARRAPLVPEHVGWPGLPAGVVVVVTAVRGSSVPFSPSTRTVTFAGAASAGAAHANATTSPAITPDSFFFMSQPLSARVSNGDGRRQVSWLPGPPPRPFPARAAGQWARSPRRRPDASGLPGHSGGSAPESHRTSPRTDPGRGGCYRASAPP